MQLFGEMPFTPFWHDVGAKKPDGTSDGKALTSKCAVEHFWAGPIFWALQGR